mmetsp:Transcript_36260/g.58611  ORF Transcript_36260/g.58611 Transcript_36260/m.58611 type:complete len:155 (+) Transcript_36260:130-594(+)
METLPDALFVQIMSFLSARDLLSISLLSSRFRHLWDDQQIWNDIFRRRWKIKKEIVIHVRDFREKFRQFNQKRYCRRCRTLFVLGDNLTKPPVCRSHRGAIESNEGYYGSYIEQTRTGQRLTNCWSCCGDGDRTSPGCKLDRHVPFDDDSSPTF